MSRHHEIFQQSKRSSLEYVCLIIYFMKQLSRCIHLAYYRVGIRLTTNKIHSLQLVHKYLVLPKRWKYSQEFPSIHKFSQCFSSIHKNSQVPPNYSHVFIHIAKYSKVFTSIPKYSHILIISLYSHTYARALTPTHKYYRIFIINFLSWSLGGVRWYMFIFTAPFKLYICNPKFCISVFDIDAA